MTMTVLMTDEIEDIKATPVTPTTREIRRGRKKDDDKDGIEDEKNDDDDEDNDDDDEDND